MIKVAQGNKETILTVTEAFNRQDRQTFDSCYADPFLIHFRNGDRVMSHEEHWEAVRRIVKVFPDLHATIDSLIAEDDRVFVRWSYTGTRLGESPSGIEPTGEKVDFGVCWAENRLENGVIAEIWELSDLVPL